jgi:hypothetical protein
VDVPGGVRPWTDGDVVGAHGTGMLSPPPPWVEQAVADAREPAAVVLCVGPPSAAVEFGDVALQAARAAMLTAAQAGLAAHRRIRSRIIRPPDHEGFSYCQGDLIVTRARKSIEGYLNGIGMVDERKESRPECRR